MNAPVIFILFPLFISVLLWLLQERAKFVKLAGISVGGLLILLAWKLPIGEGINIGAFSIQFPSVFTVFGRSLTILPADRSILLWIYFIQLLWLTGSLVISTNKLFVPASLGMVSLFVAALAVTPFLYAALLIELAVLISIPMLSPSGTRTVPKGVLRYLIFMTLAMPFILITGWMFTGVNAGSPALDLLVRGGVMLGLGFAFLLAVFPFYTWLPLLAEQDEPYVVGFVFILLPTVVLIFGLNFLDQYTWLRTSPGLSAALQLTGTLMVVTGGIWAAFQNHMGRLMGYAVIVETGFSLIALSPGNSTGYTIFSTLFLPRLAGLFTASMALAVISKNGRSLLLEDSREIIRTTPFATMAFLFSILSFAGLPLLAGFPVHLAVFEEISQISLGVSFWALLGSSGLLVGALRCFMVFTSGGLSSEVSLNEKPGEIILLTTGVLALILLGIFPQIFLPQMTGLLTAFQHLGR